MWLWREIKGHKLTRNPLYYLFCSRQELSESPSLSAAIENEREETGVRLSAILLTCSCFPTFK